jgi:hypothetical protein
VSLGIVLACHAIIFPNRLFRGKAECVDPPLTFVFGEIIMQTGLRNKPESRGTKMLEEIKKIERRMFRHSLEDGVFEIVFGVFLLLSGSFFLAYSFLPKNMIFLFAFFIGYSLTTYLTLLLMKKMVRSLREKLTWPRTGYVSYQEGKQRRLKAGLRGGIAGFFFPILAGLAQDLLGSVPGFYSFPAIFGLILVISFCWISFRSGLVRFAAFGGLYAVIGLILSFSGWKHMQAWAALCGVIGISLLLSGLFFSRRYLHRNPVPAEDPQ